MGLVRIYQNCGGGGSGSNAVIIQGTGYASSVRCGAGNTASGNYSMAWGKCVTASGVYSTASGYYTFSQGDFAKTSGKLTTASGGYSTSSGYGTTAAGRYSMAIGQAATSSGCYGIAMGDNVLASECHSRAFNRGSHATAAYSTASGYYSQACASHATSSGYRTLASGHYSTASGCYTTANNVSASASGSYTTASGYMSSVCGNLSTASGCYSTAAGVFTTASGSYSISQGLNSTASQYGQRSWANGTFSKSDTTAQQVQFVLRNLTLNASINKVYLDGSSSEIIVKPNTTMLLNIYTVGMETSTGAHEVASSQDYVLVKNVAGTTSIIHQEVIAQHYSTGSLAITIGITDANDTLNIKVTGTTNQMRWMSYVNGVELTFT